MGVGDEYLFLLPARSDRLECLGIVEGNLELARGGASNVAHELRVLEDYGRVLVRVDKVGKFVFVSVICGGQASSISMGIASEL